MLDDFIADGDDELDDITLGTGFKGITDIETSPDGFLYVLTFDERLMEMARFTGSILNWD